MSTRSRLLVSYMPLAALAFKLARLSLLTPYFKPEAEAEGLLFVPILAAETSKTAPRARPSQIQGGLCRQRIQIPARARRQRPPKGI